VLAWFDPNGGNLTNMTSKSKKQHEPATPAPSPSAATPPAASPPAAASAPATSAAAAADPNATVLTMPVAELQQRVAQAVALWGQIVALFPGTVVLTSQERLSTPKMGSDEEPALLAVLKVADTFPQFFTSLADLDEGTDPTTFETGLQRDRMARADALAPLAQAFATQPVGIDDTVLLLRGEAKEVVGRAYAIAKSLAPTNQPLSTLLAPALNYYRAIAKAAAATRAANAKAKAAAKPPATS
jgi:hypothetical protein